MDFTFNIHFTMYVPSVPLFFYNGLHFAAMYIHLKKIVIIDFLSKLYFFT